MQSAFGDSAALFEPNPRTVSNELLARDTFIPATSLNLLAAAWLQFMVHDWLSHGQNSKERPWAIPLPASDAWPIQFTPSGIIWVNRSRE